MEERNKENSLSPAVYAKLVQNEAALASYLKSIRQQPPLNRIILLRPKSIDTTPKQAIRKKVVSTQVKAYVEEYLKLIREITSMQNSSSRKSLNKMIQYLQEFPTLKMLVQIINTFGKKRKRICLSESVIMSEVNDDMIPLFKKIIQKAQQLKKQAQSRKLIELGQRIVHLQRMVEVTHKQHFNDADSSLGLLQPQRVQKYLSMQENINRAEKKYGSLSLNFQKNQELFSNINKVYQQINKSKQVNH